MYRFLFDRVLSRWDPERAHHLAYAFIRGLGLPPVAALLRTITAPAAKLRIRTMNLTFPSPFGLAAGFDKDGYSISGLASLGFGHVEVGTLTSIPQLGNPRPRLFRLIADQALVNRMGFNNSGAAAGSRLLQRASRRRKRPVIGVNIGKSRIVAVEDAVADYSRAAALLAPHADYVAINVSSPNTPGLRGLQQIEQLAPLLSAVLDIVGEKPLLVKIAPDLTDEQIRSITRLAVKLGLAGIIATNTTVARAGLRSDAASVASVGDGGLSGRPLAARSLEVLRLIRQEAPDTHFCVISVGGVSTAQDVAERLSLGATLVQGYSAFVYQGPAWAYRINRDLAKLSS